MLAGQRVPVHGDGQQRISPVEGDLHREAGGEAVDRLADHLLGTGLHPGLPQQVVEADAGPPGVADQVATDLVGDALQGDRHLDQLPIQDVVVGELELPVDHASDLEPPGLGVHHGRGEGRVDPVEVRGRGDVGADARHRTRPAVERSRRDRRAAAGRGDRPLHRARRVPERGARRPGRTSPDEQQPPDDPGVEQDGPSPDPDGRAGGAPRRGGGALVRRGGARPVPVALEQERDRHADDHRRDAGHEGGRQRAERI
ncbi:MAG: hypothetical protein U0P45_06215 [Acidimicrobiales bacterium]